MSYCKISSSTIVFLALTACSDSGNDSMIETPNDTSSTITLDASARAPFSDDLTINYTVTNVSSQELIIFDAVSRATVGMGDDGVIILFKAKRDTGFTDFESRPTIAGRNLSPDQTLTGLASQGFPTGIDFDTSSESLDLPDTVRLCLGFGNADDIIPTTLVDGTFSLNQDLDLQELTCSGVLEVDRSPIEIP